MPKSRRRKKVSYNPLKMLGSWIGIILGIILTNVHAYTGFLNKIFGNELINLIMGSGIRQWVLSYVYLIFLGFLIGWGIHSMIRKLMK